MASLPADEDYARSVLAIFSSKNARPRESLAVSDVKAAFLTQNMGSPADLEAAPHRDRRVTGEEEVGGDAVGHEQ